MLQSVRFALSSPRRRRRRHFLLPAARSIALIPGGSRIRTCAPLSERETPTCEQRAACRATDARLLREAHSVVPPPLLLPSLFTRIPSLSHLQLGEKKKRKESPFPEESNIVFLSLSLSLSLSLFQSLLFISILLYERIAGLNIWSRATNFDSCTHYK